MKRGYVRLWRKSLDSGILKRHKVWVFFTYCLLKASYKTRKVIVGRQEIIIQPGQFIFGRRVASEGTGLTEREIRTCIESLAHLGILTIKSTTKFSIITIVNWDIYQSSGDENDQQSDQVPTRHRPQTRINELENEVESCPAPPYGEIVEFLNEICSKGFNPGSKETRRLIDARWNAGFRLDDFKKVIDGRCAKWKNDPKMVEYLRPQTLFGTKFESYLNDQPTILSNPREPEEAAFRSTGSDLLDAYYRNPQKYRQVTE